jgi:hypothetical protein
MANLTNSVVSYGGGPSYDENGKRVLDPIEKSLRGCLMYALLIIILIVVTIYIVLS